MNEMELSKLILDSSDAELIRRKTMYSIFDLARASALVQFPKESGVYKLGIERCTTAIKFLKTVIDQFPEMFSPIELAHIENVVGIHEQKNRYDNIASA